MRKVSAVSGLLGVASITLLFFVRGTIKSWEYQAVDDPCWHDPAQARSCMKKGPHQVKSLPHDTHGIDFLLEDDDDFSWEEDSPPAAYSLQNPAGLGRDVEDLEEEKIPETLVARQDGARQAGRRFQQRQKLLSDHSVLRQEPPPFDLERSLSWQRGVADPGSGSISRFVDNVERGPGRDSLDADGLLDESSFLRVVEFITGVFTDLNDVRQLMTGLNPNILDDRIEFQHALSKIGDEDGLGEYNQPLKRTRETWLLHLPRRQLRKFGNLMVDHGNRPGLEVWHHAWVQENERRQARRVKKCKKVAKVSAAVVGPVVILGAIAAVAGHVLHWW